MAKLSKADIKNISAAQERVLFTGTPENGYADSGLWAYLPFVYTKDAVDMENPIKRLLGEGDDYALIVFLYMLACDSLMIPKSRQIRMSWMSCTFALWTAMGGPVRHVIYQTKKEEDAFDQTTKGRENPGEGRIDFILGHMPSWLTDPHIASGKGNVQGQLKFSPYSHNTDGVKIPWHGSKLNAIPQGAKQVRQFTPTLYINDESAFQDFYRESIIAASACAKKMISVSSVDAGSFFNTSVLNTKTPGKRGDHQIHPIVKIGMEKMGLKWPPGMKSWMTEAGTWVLEVHHSADPKKDPERDGAEWYKNAVLRDGYEGRYDSVGWRTEMDIDYGAGGGDPVFPQVHMSTPIFIDSFRPEDIMHKMRFFAGYDYGSRNPSAFEVWGVDADNKLYAVWELYEPCTNIAEHVAKIKRCPYYDRIEVIACDPSIMSKTQQGAADIKTLGEVFEEHGLNLTRGRRGQDVTVAQIFNADFWADPYDPGAFITKACPSLAQEVLDLRWDKHLSDAVAARKNNPERIRDKRNHGFDATAVIIDYGVQPFVPEVFVPSAGTYMQAVKDLRMETYLEKRRNGGSIHVQ